MKTKTILTVWRWRTYEVWGNKRDGYEVNDVRNQGTIEIRCKVETNNPGMPGEFLSAFPSIGQLQGVFGTRAELSIDGDDMTIYVNRASDGYPLGELQCESHASLSPIREKPVTA